MNANELSRNKRRIPDHLLAAVTQAQREFLLTCYERHPTGLGPEYYQASRSLEFLRTPERRDFFLEYYPDEALAYLERFKSRHYDQLPDKGFYAESSIALRVRNYYPELFRMLMTRLRPFEFIADTHPDARIVYDTILRLDAEYHRGLAAALQLTKRIEDRKKRNERLHELYRLAFEAVYPDLHAVLKDLANSY